ncbi:thioredoxin domain-containing protein [Polaribacter aquimarinus]|uniref:Thioredoxin domain-containing protein n=1 Tax=Polaribacter aquimarinus TaxID=2100726 RepID=A0A2U2J6X2_9FLAO|nr:hypothetical protein [Polaribacter aquimarinus]PWG04031.1 hypothetical protein DIS07_14900 [Polaribacter aquimarinus]
MKKGILIFVLIFKSIFSFSNEKDELFVVYSKDCNYSKKLINETFENLAIKENLKKYSLKKLEISEAKSIIEEYKIVEFPTQIIKKNGKFFLVKGFQNVEQQNKILLNPNKYQKNKPLSFMAQMFICSYVKNLSTFEKIISKVKYVAEKEGFKVGNIYKFISDRQNEIICKNTKHVKLRDKAPLFKFAIDTGNYAFVEDLIDHDEDGKCNPNIDYQQKEVLPNGEEEDLLGFLNKLIYNVENNGFDAAHKKSDLVHIRRLLVRCYK